MTAGGRASDAADFTCTVELIMSPLMRFLGAISGLNPAIRRHTLIETQGFAADIVRKARTKPAPLR